MFRILVFIFISSIVYASTPTKIEGWSGNFDLGLNFTKNIESTLQFNNIFLLNYNKNASHFIINNNIAFISKTGEKELLNKGTQDFKYAFRKKKIDANFTCQHFYDISRLVKNRFTSGLGLSYRLYDIESKKLALGLSALREKEIHIEGEYKLQNRLSGNLDFMLKLNKNISISTTNNYQPNIETAGDFRWKTNLDFRIHLSSQFLLSLAATYNYDSVPAENLPESDYQLINSVSYTF
ncbi:DUF481 domain-containing protein [Flavobacteriales bacterium]|nr:DUF481 domain-containing protein [Flavobacteriales bacterium]